MLANFGQLSGEREVRIHPIVARLVDAELLQKLRAAADAGPRDEHAPAAPAAIS